MTSWIDGSIFDPKVFTYFSLVILKGSTPNLVTSWVLLSTELRNHQLG